MIKHDAMMLAIYITAVKEADTYARKRGNIVFFANLVFGGVNVGGSPCAVFFIGVGGVGEYIGK